MEYVIYIEDFGEDKKTDNTPQDKKFEKIGEMKIFEEKVPSVLTILNKMNINENFSEDTVPTFSAKNFMNNTFIHYPFVEYNKFIDGAFWRNKFFLN